MADVSVIEVHALKKHYRKGRVKVAALNGVSFKICPTEFVIIFGPSGCGKSTLLSLLAGLDYPTFGRVIVRGEDIFDLSEKDITVYRRKKVGMVFQNFNLVPSMNAWENVALPLVFDNFTYAYRKKRALSLLDKLGLAERAYHYPSELSGGEMQRIAIARALIHNPWILLVDEPTGDLDSENANAIMSLLNDINKKGKRTLLLVTHNPDYLHYADKVIRMKDGKIVK